MEVVKWCIKGKIVANVRLTHKYMMPYHNQLWLIIILNKKLIKKTIQTFCLLIFWKTYNCMCSSQSLQGVNRGIISIPICSLLGRSINNIYYNKTLINKNMLNNYKILIFNQEITQVYAVLTVTSTSLRLKVRFLS